MHTNKAQSENRRIVVACFGASTAASKGTFDWIKEVKRRPQNNDLRFVNLGVGGDLAYNAFQRVPKVIACHPDKVIILIGGNDVLSQVFENVGRLFRVWKRLPSKPSPEWFRENLLAIVRRIKGETPAKIALVSVQEIGEDPASTNPVQQELNERVEQYNQIIKEISRKEMTGYIPLYEALHQQIMASPGRAFTNFSFLSFYRDYVLRELILGHSFDEIARMNGYQFHIDGVHLNTRGGEVLADLVQEFLDR